MISMENYEFVDICVFICLYSIGNHKKKYSNNSFIHILFTYSDVLTRHLVMAAVNWDKKDNFNKPPSQRSNRHVEDLVATFNSCGICFNVWEKPNADGKGSGIMDFTSLMGKDKKNKKGSINFTLINHIGEAVIDQTVESDLILESLDYYSNMCGIKLN